MQTIDIGLCRDRHRIVPRRGGRVEIDRQHASLPHAEHLRFERGLGVGWQARDTDVCQLLETVGAVQLQAKADGLTGQRLGLQLRGRQYKRRGGWFGSNRGNRGGKRCAVHHAVIDHQLHLVNASHIGDKIWIYAIGLVQRGLTLVRFQREGPTVG